MKKAGISLILLFLSFTLFAQAAYDQDEEYTSDPKKEFDLFAPGSVFQLDLTKESVIIGTGLLLNGTWLLCDKGLKLNHERYPNQILDSNDVNAFDRNFMKPYSHTLDVTGDIVMAVTLLTPLCLCQTDKNEWLQLGIMYGETMLLANGIKEIGKLCVNRPRPYSYFQGGPDKKYKNGDWAKSWPSGHTTFAFAGATFASYVFAQYYPDSTWKYVVIAGSYSLACTTAVLRIQSGNHFVTDVLTGAVIGTACGFFVPWLHLINEQTGRTLTITPTSLNFNFTF
ncbi:MAG: phosphatase PAP2 family protein [Treponema sp.]|nr:phosphatase PAP2 family protein [Treponema sp.]